LGFNYFFKKIIF